jgi:hypothetical protein
MKNKVNLMVMILAVLICSCELMAQETTKIVRPNDRMMEEMKPDKNDAADKMPVIGCCKCLGGTSSINLSTTSGNNWTFSGNPVVFLASPNSYWNLPTGGASWVSTVATGASANLPVGTTEYELKFRVLNCTIPQKVTLTGNVGGDDEISVYLDSTSNPALTSCSAGGWCFNTKNPPPAINTTVTSGIHTLIVRVKNGMVSPTGMFVNATLTSNCSSSPTKSNKEQ